MARPREDEYVKAKSDGLPARRNGSWAKDKLSFLDEYLPPALQATIRKTQRFYVDLFAGPGLNVDDDENEFPGATIRALRSKAQANAAIGFTHAFLVNLDPIAHNALRTRVERSCEDGECAVPGNKVEFMREDANKVVNAIMRRMHVKSYVFVFADIEKPNQLPFDTVRSLKMHGHESVDFCVLYPSDMAIKRLLPFERVKLDPNIPALNAYLGTDRWLELWERRKTDAQSPELYRSMQRLYENQLRSVGWKHVIPTRYVRRQGEAKLYQLLLASNADAAKNLADWSADKDRDRRGPELDLFD
jgi:three-Cys-motif partner protein